MASETTNLRVKLLLVFAISSALVAGLVFFNERAILSDKKKSAGGFSKDATYILSRQINDSLAATYTIAILVHQRNGVVSDFDFDSLASHLLELHRGSISALAIAPGAVASRIFPLKGNEKAIGHNLLEDPARRNEALAAIESRRLYLAGPLELVQGGTAVIGRLPVFLRNNRGEEQFWGFTASVVSIGDLLRAARIEGIAEAGYHYQLWRIHPDTGERHVFAKSADFPVERSFSTSFEIPGGKWTLSVLPMEGLHSPVRLAIEIFFAFCFATFTAFVARSWLRQPVQLQQEVEARTRELTTTNLLYQDEIAQRERAEQTLRESEERFATVFQSSPIAISLTRLSDGKFLDVNNAFANLCGYTRTDLLSRDAIELNLWRHLKHRSELVAGLREHGRVEGFETQGRAKTGDVKDVTIVAELVALAGEQYILGLTQDISERKRMEEELDRHRQHLEDLVRDRTLQLEGRNALLAAEVAERRRAEEALIESEARLSSVFRTSPTGIFIIRLGDAQFLDVNDAFLRILGYPAEEVLCRTPRELNLWVDADDRDRLVRTAREGGAIEGCEIQLRCKSGEIVDLLASALPLERGGEACVLGTLTDITDRNLAEQAVRDSEARFRLLSGTAARLLASEAPQEIVSELCREVMEHLDCQAFFNFLVDEEAGRLRLNTCAGIPDEEARRIEWLDYGVAVCGCAARDGVRIVAADIFNIPDPRTELVKSYGIQAYACHPLMSQGRVIGTLSFGTKTRTGFSSQDLALMKTVTDQVAAAMERMRLIGELQRSRDGLELRVQERTAELAGANAVLHEQAALLDMAHDAIFVRNIKNEVVFWNRGAEETYGWKKDDALGRAANELFQTRFPAPLDEIKAVLYDQGEWEGELVHLTAHGAQIVVDSRWALQKDATGKLTGFLEINRDITARKKAEEELKAYTARLETLNRELTDFAFIASHDLQEPLRKIQAFGDRLGRMYTGIIDAEGQDYLGRMQSAAARMSILLKDLLAYSRVATRQQPFDTISLSEAAADAISALELRIQQTGSSVEVSDLPAIRADRSQMYQLFQNLIGNALKFRGEEQPRIKVYALPSDPGVCRIAVEDNGVGFDEQYMDQIFLPFQRLHGRSRYEGTGMGLAICRKIVERHGGSISASSKPGNGSIFIVTLPLAQK